MRGCLMSYAGKAKRKDLVAELQGQIETPSELEDVYKLMMMCVRYDRCG